MNPEVIRLAKHYFTGNRITAVWLSLMIVLFWVIFLHLTIGSAWDDYDGFAAQLFSGYLTENPYYDFYSFGQIFVGRIYALLHELIKPLPWLAIFFHLYFIVSVTIFLSVFTSFIKRKFPDISIGWIVSLQSLIFILIFSSDIIHLSHTISFLLSGSALIGIFWLVHQPSRGWKEILIYLGFLLIYVMGFLTRTETGLGASLIVGVFLVLYQNSLRKLLMILIPPAFLAVGVMVYVYVLSNQVPFLKAVELSLFYVSDGYQNRPEYKNISASDSIKYEAVMTFFINDQGEITEGLINEMAEEKVAYEMESGKPWTQRVLVAWSIMKPRILENPIICVVNLVFLFFAITIFFHRKVPLGKALPYLSFQIFFLLTLLSLAYIIKLENRHFIPLTQLYTFCNILFLIKIGAVDYFREVSVALKFFISILLVLIGLELTKEFLVSIKTESELEIYEEAVAEVNELGHGKTVLLDVNSSRIIHGRTFSLVKFPLVSKIVLYDMGELAIIPAYKSYLDKLCGCNSSRMPEFYRYLYSNKEKVLIVSTDSRVGLIQNYLRIVHGTEYKFRKLPGQRKVNLIKSGGGTLFYYVLT